MYEECGLESDAWKINIPASISSQWPAKVHYNIFFTYTATSHASHEDFSPSLENAFLIKSLKHKRSLLQGYFLKGRGEKASGDESKQLHQQAKKTHLEAKRIRATVLGKEHLEVAVSLQQAAISMAVRRSIPKSMNGKYKNCFFDVMLPLSPLSNLSPVFNQLS